MNVCLFIWPKLGFGRYDNFLSEKAVYPILSRLKWSRDSGETLLKQVWLVHFIFHLFKLEILLKILNNLKKNAGLPVTICRIKRSNIAAILSNITIITTKMYKKRQTFKRFTVKKIPPRFSVVNDFNVVILENFTVQQIHNC